jgi:hypothetical protein
MADYAFQDGKSRLEWRKDSSMKISFILGVSRHLPSGSGEDEFEALYDQEIRPLVSAVYKFPRIHMVFHYSGVLLQWIERRHPELFMLLEDLLSRKQAELLGGGFYEPMMPLLPLPDKIGQIEMLTTYLRKQFGKRPQGCWVPGPAWEQNLVSPLSACGMGYTFLDDRRFAGAGAGRGGGEFFDPCITEDQGQIITVFPVSGKVSRKLEQGKFLILKELLAALPPERECLITAFPGGLLNREAGELEYHRLFEELSRAGGDIEFTTPGKLFKSLKGLEKVYFSGCGEQGEGGGLQPRRFLVDYPEANGIYAKTVHTHVLINQLKGDKSRKRIALEELWKAQDSGVFSPCGGAFPGLCRASVRKAAYRALLEAEKITREGRPFIPSLSVFDFDLDGTGEYLFQDEKLNCYIGCRGASIFELDYLPRAWNYLDTFAERKVPGTSPARRRCAFADWLVPAGKDIPAGRFLGGEDFEVKETDRVHKVVCFRLPAREGVSLGEIETEKVWRLRKNLLGLSYTLRNTGKKTLDFSLAPGIDLAFPGEGEGFVKILALKGNAKEGVASGKEAAVKGAVSLEFRDIRNEAVISLESDGGVDFRIFPVRNAAGEYQSTCIMPLLPVSLEPGESWETSFSMSFRVSS